MGATQSELTLARLVDEREVVRGKHENKLAEIAARDDKAITGEDENLLTSYRESAVQYDSQIDGLMQAAEAHRKSVEESKAIRRMLSGDVQGVDVDGDGVVYRDMATYARDVILTRTTTICSQIASQYANPADIERAKERLQLVKRVDSTLSSNVGGLIPDQHIAQIFQIIDTSRPIVASALRATLERGVLSYPRVDERPEVDVQGTEKQEAGNNGMEVSMQTATASTYLGGGDLSWQAINWSTPDALNLWFQLAGADYALKTEADAALVITHSAFTNDQISSPLDATPSFAEFMTAVGDGYSEVFANSNRIANTVYMAPDRFGYLLGMTSDAFAQFVSINGDSVGPLSFIVSRGLDAGTIIVGDRAGLLVAETAGAPVELRVVEPAIGGVEVGIIGAFEAVVVDSGAFSLITAAS